MSSRAQRHFGDIAGAIERQGGATHMISAMSRPPRKVQRRSPATSPVRETARDTGTAAAEVLHSAREVTDQAEALRGRIASFLSSVRQL